MKQITKIFLALLLLAAGCKHKSTEEAANKFALTLTQPYAKQVQVAVTGVPLVKQMWLALSEGAVASGEKFPLVISVHGLGETNNIAATGRVSMAYNIGKGNFPASFTVHGKTYAPIFASPCLTTNDRGGLWIWDYIQFMIKNYPVDPDKIYIIGLSQGGGGIYYFLSTATWGNGLWPPFGVSKVAAVVPIAGNYPPNYTITTNMRKYGVHAWQFNNAGDNIVGLVLAQDWYNKIQTTSYGIDTFTRLTVFPYNGHGGWNQATDPNYKEVWGKDTLNIYQWLLQFKKKDGITVLEERPIITPPPTDTTQIPPTDTVTVPPTDTTTTPTDTIPLPAIDLKVDVVIGAECTTGRNTVTVDLSKTSSQKPLNFYGYSFSYVSGPGGYTGGGVKNKITFCMRKGVWVFRAGATDISGNLSTKDIAFEVK